MKENPDITMETVARLAMERNNWRWRAKKTEAKLEQVEALLVRAGTYGSDEFGAFKRALALAALDVEPEN